MLHNSIHSYRSLSTANQNYPASYFFPHQSHSAFHSSPSFILFLCSRHQKHSSTTFTTRLSLISHASFSRNTTSSSFLGSVFATSFCIICAQRGQHAESIASLFVLVSEKHVTAGITTLPYAGIDDECSLCRTLQNRDFFCTGYSGQDVLGSARISAKFLRPSCIHLFSTEKFRKR